MSYDNETSEVNGRASPKRRRVDAHESASPNGHASAEHQEQEEADLQYAREDDGDSDGDNVYATPRDDLEDEGVDQHIEERPTRLNYVLHKTLRGHKRGVAQVRYSPDGQWIASCSADATIKIWSATSGELVQTLEGHLAGVSTISWSPDSKVLASGSDDKLIRLWDTSSGKCLPQPLIGHHNYVYSIAFSPKGNMIVSGSYDEAVFLWDVRTARLMRSLPAHSDPVSGVDFVRDGTLIVSCSSDGLIRVWDTATGQCLKTLVHEDNAQVTSVRFSPNGKFVLAATLDSSVRLWDYVDGRCVKTYQGHKNQKFSINTAFGTYGVLPAEAYHSNGETITNPQPKVWAFIACGSEDGKIYLWDVSSKEILQEIPAHDGVVLGVDISSTSQEMVTCGADSIIKIWKRRPLKQSDQIGKNGYDQTESGLPILTKPDADIATPRDEHATSIEDARVEEP